MCGILGINRRILEKRFLSALTRIAHRGPDDRGWVINENVSLGHHRLAILDLSANGHQPMSILDGQVSIIFNGEIYNHLELRRELGDQSQFRGTSDTETILHGYLKYGKDIVEHLNGIFSFAIYDQRHQELFLARDHLGVKPLYYYHRDGLLAFSSEIKAIIELPDVDRAINPASFVDYIHYLWSPGDGTPFKYIKKLLPGHHLTCRLSEPHAVAIEKYYELPFSGEYSGKSEAALTDELDELLNAAVQRQLLSDVPVGFFLSGGLDSSLIAAIARRRLGSEFNCYTIRVREQTSVDGFADDLVYARNVARHLGVRLFEVDADIDIVRDFDQMIWHLDEPQADPAPLNVLNICQEARRRGDVVLLGGTAGDDLFSGYRRHQALRFEPAFNRTPRIASQFLAAAIGSLPLRIPLVRRLQKLVVGMTKDGLHRMLGYYAWIDPHENKRLFNDYLRQSIENHDPTSYLATSLKNIGCENSPINQMLYWDLKYFLPDHNLNYTDKMSMAVGVEVRVPFLDLELVDFACRLPPSLKLNGRTTKYLLKKVAERYLPKRVIYRPKTGFGAPVRSWIMAGLMDPLIDRYLNESRVRDRGVFDAQRVSDLIARTKAGMIDAAYTVWSLLAVESWITQFTDCQPVSKIGTTAPDDSLLKI